MLKVKPDFCTTHIQKFATASFLFDLKLLKGSKVLESGSIYLQTIINKKV